MLILIKYVKWFVIEGHHTATRTHMPPGSGDFPVFTGTHFSDPERM